MPKYYIKRHILKRLTLKLTYRHSALVSRRIEQFAQIEDDAPQVEGVSFKLRLQIVLNGNYGKEG
jgi:hypothetical protein